MEIEIRHQKIEYLLTLDKSELLTYSAALKYFAEKHPVAQNRDEWLEQAQRLDEALRRF